MKYFIEFVLQSLVEFPDEVDVRELEEESNILFQVRVNPDDIGRVIGKNGKTIGAIRGLLNAAALKSGKKVTLELIEEKTAPVE